MFGHYILVIQNGISITRFTAYAYAASARDPVNIKKEKGPGFRSTSPSF